ncbi:fibronectin type III domain-containing protein [Sphingorhabdus sp.]|uniref:fibronectin type III domain-containing protein n=1 Tax=Sphingorhabdus sp. TaxID=1902408 RepID=UPI00333E1E61
MSIFLGSAAPTTYKLGATAVSKICLGATQVWPAGPVITQQPKNNFSVTYNQNAAFSVTATGVGTLSYQWQGYYYDFYTGNYGWNDISGATESTFGLSGNTAYNYGINSWSTGGMMQMRVVVTDATAATKTSQIVRWIDYSMVSPYADFYGNNGSYSSGTTSVGGVTYSNMSLQEDETVNVNVYDMGYTYFDTSWYSSNAFTVKLQSLSNATTWTDVETYNYRGSGFYFGTTLAARSGVVYFRVLVIENWPLTVTNGTQSATRTAPQIVAAAYKLTWPVLTSKIYDTYLGADVMSTQRDTNIVDTYLGADVMATQNVTNIVDTYLAVDVLCAVGSTLGAPLNLIATAGDGEIAATWSAPGYDGGSSITDYTVQYSDDAGATWTTFSDGVSTTRAVTITGLANGSTYKIRVAAVNADGTGPYVTSGSYALVALPVITQQPTNDYATASTQQITFSVTATIATGTLTYQWQYFGADYNNGDYDYRWRNIPDATTSSYATTGNIMSNLLSYDFYYTGTAQLRCAISASGGGAPKYTVAVRFMQLDNLHYPYPNWYGNYGTYTDWSGSFQTMSPQSGESLIVSVYDYAMSSPDTSWYTGNDTTLKIQVATTGATSSADWTDLYTVNSRGYIYLSGYEITPDTGTKYYRVIAVNKWPYATNNGTSSVTHETQYVYPYDSYSAIRVTWP